MRRLRFFILLLVCLIGSTALCQNEGWLPVTPEDLQAKEPPSEPGAAAIQLYHANWIDDGENKQFIYNRIKILTKAGMKYADIEISMAGDNSVDDLKARTIHPDGSIAEFTGKPFEKTIFKSRGVKILAKTFAMPDVTEGSIIEYKYTLNLRMYRSTELWVLQHPLYTVKESFRFRPPRQIRAAIAWVVSNWTGAMPVRKGDGADLDLENVAAFHTEEYMPPEERFRATVRFYYLTRSITSSDKYWEFIGEEWSQEYNRFIGDHKEAKEAAAAAIGNETDPEKQLRRLYARAQEFRNLSYERSRTEKERKEEELKPNHDVADVFNHGYGYTDNIAVAFVAMARAAGFEAWVVRASSRRDGFFEKESLSSQQLGWAIVLVKLKGKNLFLDPGTRFCPFGLLRWTLTSTDAMLLDKKGGSFVVTPAAPQNKALVKRTLTASLSDDGTLKGDLRVEFYQTDALEHRLEALRTDDAGRKKSLEDEIKATLVSENAIVTLKDVQGWESTDDPLIATFSVEIPGYASAAGKRLIVPSCLFRVKQKDAFNQPDRKYPIYFSYAFSELDSIHLRFPPGFSPETVPVKHVAALGYATYEDAFQVSNEQLIAERALLINGFIFNLDVYPQLKDFFTKVAAGDEQQAVLRSGVTAEKSN